MYNKQPSYEYLYLFRDVMRCGSFQKLARECDTTPASIGKKIARLESELGVPLFESGSNGMVPTAAGLYLYDRLDPVLWNLDSTIHQAKNIPAENSMKIDIGISEMISGTVYRSFMLTFARTYPDISFSLSTLNYSDMLRRLIEGRTDIAVTFSLGLINEPRLERMPLLRSKPGIYYSNEMDVGSVDELGINAFRESTFVCLNTDVATVDLMRDLPYEPKRIIFAENLKSLMLYVNAGLGCAIFSPYQQLFGTEGISFFELSDANYYLGVDLIWEKSNTNPAVRLLTRCAELSYPTIEQVREPR